MVLTLPATDPRAVVLVTAIVDGDLTTLAHHLAATPALATARIVDEQGVARTPLHVVADWPGHRPSAAGCVALLIAAGADVDATVGHAAPGGAPETPLHWAASCDDVDVLDALLDHGADIEAPGAVFTGGTAMSDAVVFAQWRAARRLLERGATTTLWQAAALGLLERVQADAAAAAIEELTNALWHACRGGQRATAEHLLDRGADLNWIGYDHQTPLDAAHEHGAVAFVRWLTPRGATRAARSGSA